MTPARFRSTALALSLFVLFAVAQIAASQAAGGQQTPPPAMPQTGQPAPAGAQPAPAARPAPPPPTPLQQWLNDTRKIEDPAKKLEALRSIRSGSASALRNSGTEILSLLINTFPDRTKEIDAAFKQVLDDIPASSSPESRLAMTVSAAILLLDKNLLLDKAEAAVAQAYETFDPEKYAATMRTMAADAKRPVPSEKQLNSTVNSAKARALETLGRLHMALGDSARGEKELKEVLTLNPVSAPAAIALAESAAKGGDKAEALEYYFAAALGGLIKPADEAAMRDLYRGVRGSDAGFEDAWDKAYRDKMPNPVTFEKYVRTPNRTSRTVLAEMFTGSGCPPCAAADLALDAAMARYRPEDLIALAYHVHIPQPDPMTTPGSMTRKEYYKVPGVPTIHVDGGGEPASAGRGYVKVGGGDRDGAASVFTDYVKAIDTELEIAPRATLAVRASLDGERVKVTAGISNVAPEAKEVKLHVILAEHELRFSGENGIRFHPMVVRGVAGDDKPGLPVTLESGKATVLHTFDLAAIREQIGRSLADELVKRREQTKAAAVQPTYRAEGHAYTDIDSSALAVIVFLQDADQNVLQAARIDVAPARTKR